jgi:hypothetical protein
MGKQGYFKAAFLPNVGLAYMRHDPLRAAYDAGLKVVSRKASLMPVRSPSMMPWTSVSPG